MGGATRGGMAEPTLRDQNKIRQERGQGKGENRIESQRGGKFWRANGGGEAEQSSASCDKAKRAIENVRVDGRSQLPRTTSGRWRSMGRTELDGR